jgi:hypothetical protein
LATKWSMPPVGREAVDPCLERLIVRDVERGALTRAAGPPFVLALLHELAVAGAEADHGAFGTKASTIRRPMLLGAAGDEHALALKPIHRPNSMFPPRDAR